MIKMTTAAAMSVSGHTALKKSCFLYVNLT